MADFLYFAPAQQGSGDGLSWASAKALTAAALNAALAEVGPGGRIYIRANDGDAYAVTAPLVLSNGGSERAPIIIQMQQTDGKPPHANAWLTGNRPTFVPPADLEATTDVSTWDTSAVNLFTLTSGAHWLTFNTIRARNISSYAFGIGASIRGLTVNDFDGFNVRSLVWDTFPLHNVKINRANVTGYSRSFVRFDKPASQDIEILGPSVWDSRRQNLDPSQQPRALSLNAGRNIRIEGITAYRGHFGPASVRTEGVYLEQDAVNVSMKKCSMNGFTAAGFTIFLNGTNTFDNLTATDNARNFVFAGSAGAILPGLVSRSPNLRGFTAPARHLDLAGNNATLDVSGGIFTGGGTLVQLGYATDDSGYAVQYLDGFTSAATATAGRTGASVQLLGDITQTATGRYVSRGQGLDALEVVQEFLGGILVKASGTQAIPAITQVAYSGTAVKGPVFGSARHFVTLDEAAAGTVANTPDRNASAAQTLSAILQAAFGNLVSLGTRTATAIQTVPAIPQATEVDVLVRGSSALTVDPILQAALGGATVPRTLTGAQTLAALIQVASGDVDPRLTGAQTLAAFTQSASAKAIITAQQAQDPVVIPQVALGDVDPKASAAQVIPAFTQAATGTVGATLAKLSSVTDTFTIDDTATWTKYQPIAAGDVVVTGGQVQVKLRTGYPALYLPVSRDFTESSASVQLVSHPGANTAGSAQAALQVMSDDDLHGYMIDVSGNPLTLSAWVMDGAGWSLISSLSYVAATHAYLRIRHSGGTIFFDTSADGATYTNRFSRAALTPFDHTRARAKLSAGDWNADNTSVAVFDNFNRTGAAAGTVSALAAQTIPPLSQNATGTVGVSSKMSGVTDTFATDDTVKWGKFNPNAGDVVVSSGQVTIKMRTGYPALSLNAAKDFTESSASIQLVSHAGANAAGSSEAQLTVTSTDALRGYIWSVTGNPLQIAAYYKDGAGAVLVGQIAYVPATHAYLRIRHSGSTIFYDSSADGTTWTNRFSRAVLATWDHTQALAKLMAGDWNADNTSVAVFDNFNTTAAGGGTGGSGGGQTLALTQSATGTAPAMRSAVSTIYVSPTGVDTANGAIGTPVKTLARAAALAVAGSDVILRAGTFTGLQTFPKSGTSALPIIIKPFPGESVTFDGTGTAADSSLVDIQGSYVWLLDVTVKNATRSGIISWEQKGVRILNCTVNTCIKGGIWLGGATAGASANNLVEGCTVFDCVRENRQASGAAGAMGSGGWAVSLQFSNADGSIARRNSISNSYGEGLAILSSIGCQLIGNTVTDAFSVNIYLDNAQSAVVQGNVTSNTGNTNFYRSGQGAGYCCVIANEVTSRQLPSSNITVTNNLFIASPSPIFYSTFGANTGLVSSTITPNTYQ